MNRLAWTSSVTFLFTIPHSIEDFTNGIAQRFGLTVLAAAVGLGIAFAAQVWATAALKWRPTLARWLLLAIGLLLGDRRVSRSRLRSAQRDLAIRSPF